MLISELGEQALIEKLRNSFITSRDKVLMSIGDDAAVFEPEKRHILTTTDLMTEGVHFEYAWATFYQVGFKLISVNVSDIYAMGGMPAYAFLNISMVSNRAEEEFDSFLQGVKRACSVYSVDVLGGDISSSVSTDSYSATVIGFAEKIVLRSGAKPGDRVFVTGYLGDSAAGLAYLRKIKKQIPFETESDLSRLNVNEQILSAMRRHLLPVARNTEKYANRINSMIDISDGLLLDLDRICSQSNTGVALYKDKIPVSEGVKEIAASLKMDYMDFVFSGGEDYEMLISSDLENLDECTAIGEIIEDGYYLIDSSGTKEKFHPRGYTHFKPERKI